METPRRTTHGKLPTPDCTSTFGLLGADSSWRTDQRAAPRPVTPCSQPRGSEPGVLVSKSKVSEWTELIAPPVTSAVSNVRRDFLASMRAPWQSLDASGVLGGESALSPRQAYRKGREQWSG